MLLHKIILEGDPLEKKKTAIKVFTYLEEQGKVTGSFQGWEGDHLANTI